MSIAIEPSTTRRRHHSHSATRGRPDSIENGLGFAVEILLGAVIVAAPLAFGGVEYGSQWWMFLGVGGAIACLLARWIAYPRTFRPAFTWAYVPMLAFLALTAIQLVPLPASALAAVSPKAAQAWNDVGQLLPGEPIRRTLSMYPLATERQLRLVVLVCAVFSIVLTHFREREQILRLLWTLVVAGSLSGVIALSQNLSNGESTWLGVVTIHADSGPFMNHSAFGQFMNLCTGAALALLLIGLKRQIGDRAMSYRSLKHHLFRKSSASLVLPLLFIVVAPVLVALSMTRGGVLSFVIAGAVTGILIGFTQSGRGKRSLIAVIAFLILLAMLKFGFDRVYDRMATLRNAHETGAGVRLQMVRDMLPMLRDFPVVGVGLGAFAHVFPTYDTAAIAQLATHAENEYAQLAVETGAIGLGCIALFLLVLAYNAYSAIRFGRRSIHLGSAGLVFGLLCILIHSGSDFGQHVPAIACVTAAVAALLVRIGADARHEAKAITTEAPAAPRRGARLAFLALGVAVLGGCVTAIARTGNDADAEQASRRAQRHFNEMKRQGLADVTEGEFISVLQQLNAAAERMPGDAEHLYALNAMRWESIDRYDRAMTAEFHQRISDELLHVMKVAPYFGPALIFAGQVRAFDLGDASGIELIRRGYALARYSKEASYSLAMLDAQAGKWEECVQQLRRAIDLGMPRASAARLLAIQYQRNDLAEQLVEGSRPDMIALAAALDRAGRGEEATGLLSRATEILIAEANLPNAPLDALVQLAQAYIREQHYAEAIPLLRRALAQRYDRGDLRKMLVESLVQAGETEQAIGEARIHYRLNPGNPEAKQLLEDLVTMPTTPRKR